MSTIDGRSGSRPGLIHEEPRWRERPPGVTLADGTSVRINLSRVASAKVEKPLEVYSSAGNDTHVISFALRRTVAELCIGNSILKSGVVPAGMMLMSGPLEKRCHGVLYRPFSFLQVQFSQAFMAECYEYAHGKRPSSDLILFGPQLVKDPTMENLVLSLAELDDDSDNLAPMFIDGVGLALAARLIAFGKGTRPAQTTRQKIGLSKWRLNRVIEYIDANLASPIRLCDLSEVAGLSRMHFAARFRESTGLSPHAYVIQRRIVLSQELLRDRSLSIVDAALSAGFNSQSHFSGVFKKIVGKTPHRWRHELLL